MTDEKAPDAGQGVEGGDQTNRQKEDQIMNIIPDTDAARQAVREWTAEYVALSVQHHPDVNFFGAPDWPAAATPSWASEVEVGAEVSGEVLILFAREVGEVALVSSVGVIVSDDPAFEHNHPGKVVGDLLPEPGGVTLRLVGEHEELRSADAMRLFDSLATAIVLLRKIETVA